MDGEPNLEWVEWKSYLGRVDWKPHMEHVDWKPYVECMEQLGDSGHDLVYLVLWVL
jgi:hypothetical protein